MTIIDLSNSIRDLQDQLSDLHSKSSKQELEVCDWTSKYNDMKHCNTDQTCKIEAINFELKSTYTILEKKSIELKSREDEIAALMCEKNDLMLEVDLLTKSNND